MTSIKILSMANDLCCMTRKDVAPDGNCLVRAIMVSMGKSSDDYLQLRRDAFKEYEAHKSFYIDLTKNMGTSPVPKYNRDEYLGSVGTDRDWLSPTSHCMILASALGCSKLIYKEYGC